MSHGALPLSSAPSLCAAVPTRVGYRGDLYPVPDVAVLLILFVLLWPALASPTSHVFFFPIFRFGLDIFRRGKDQFLNWVVFPAFLNFAFPFFTAAAVTSVACTYCIGGHVDNP